MGILNDILSDVGAEMGRLGVQGQMEMASALFGNGAFVPYGPGQYTPSHDNAVAAPEVANIEAPQAPMIEEQSQGREM